jgi:hypothetical protein
MGLVERDLSQGILRAEPLWTQSSQQLGMDCDAELKQTPSSLILNL